MSLMIFILDISIQMLCMILSSSIIVFFILKNNKPPVVYPYIWCMSMVFVWSLGQLLQAFSYNTQSLWLFEVFKYLGICYIGLGWMLFCLYYTNHRLLHYKVILLLLFILPTVSFIAVLTNDLHHLFYPFFKYSPIDTGRLDFGILFYYHTAVSYSQCLAGAIILIKYSIKSFGYNKKQSVLLISAVSIPLITSIIITFDFIQPDFDITPLSFTVSLFIFSIAIIKYKFLNIIPVAIKSVFENMKESIMVIDTSGIIVDLNHSFVSIFQEMTKSGVSDTVGDFVHNLTASTIDMEQSKKVLDGIMNETMTFESSELTLGAPHNKCFFVNIQPVYNAKNEYLGKVVSFNDITEYKNLLEKFHQSNIELSAANEKLKEHALTVESLTLERERTRFARDVHDSLGHSMTLLITLLTIAHMECPDDPPTTRNKLSEALQIARTGLKEIRRSVSGMTSERLNDNSAVNAIQSLIDEFKTSGTEIQFTVDGIEIGNHLTCSNVLYRVCQEALTNALRHGKAKHVNIILMFKKENIKLYIFDDGKGCDTVNKGFGLTGMENRVKSVGGTLIVGSGEEGGFNINIEIPVKGD